MGCHAWRETADGRRGEAHGGGWHGFTRTLVSTGHWYSFLSGQSTVAAATGECSSPLGPCGRSHSRPHRDNAKGECRGGANRTIQVYVSHISHHIKDSGRRCHVQTDHSTPSGCGNPVCQGQVSPCQISWRRHGTKGASVSTRGVEVAKCENSNWVPFSGFCCSSDTGLSIGHHHGPFGRLPGLLLPAQPLRWIPSEKTPSEALGCQVERDWQQKFGPTMGGGNSA
mmetsp:Transcript_24117/g.48709  ORF Transcript_24117/g.48709 Transcript_24117/m.48709 type:complete len:226 (-) Transcript_24117:4173-4850(-)